MPEEEKPPVPEPSPRYDDSTAIAILKEQVAGLQHQVEALTTERNEFRDALEVIGEERDQLQAAAQTPDAQAQRIKELEGQIRTGKHREAFRGLAGKDVHEGALSDLFDLMRSKPSEFGIDPKAFDADEPDAKVYEAALAKARETRGYAFRPAETEAAGGNASEPDKPTWPGNFQPGQTPPPAGTGRGQRNTGGDGTLITPEMRADPGFMLNPANRETIYAAAREGRIR